MSFHLLVKNNSKCVRGKTQSRKEIEDTILSQFQMVKPDKNGCEYLLSIPYQNDEDLDDIIYNEILGRRTASLICATVSSKRSR